ncbi:MAG: GNAT family N-acetyltransferase [Actinomycetota bacterium]
METASGETIRSERLDLVSTGAPFMRAVLEGRLEVAQGLAGMELPPGWDRRAEWLLRVRLSQIENDPATAPWLLRLVKLRATGAMVGHVNFHGPPDTEGWAEIGYEIEPEHRKRGYASEASRAMFWWAAERGVASFRASVAPDNQASLALVQRLGFHRIGEQWDDLDGLEHVFAASVEELRAVSAAPGAVSTSSRPL